MSPSLILFSHIFLNLKTGLAFAVNILLVSLDFSNFNTSLVTDMSSMFYSCEKLVSLDLSTFDISSVNYLSYMFCYGYALEYLDISNFNPDPEKLIDDDSMFYGIDETLNI